MANIVDNWALIVVLFCFVVMFILYLRNFAKKPSSEQILALKEYLLWAVVQAEKELGGGTGQLKLRMVYDLAINRFSFITTFISFELFSAYVDEALDKMKVMLQSNPNVKSYVEGSEL